MESPPFVRIENLTFSRGDRLIFDNVSLTIPTGKITAIMGPSGTGKTTLLHLISRVLTPDSGRIYVRDQNIAKLSKAALYELRRSMGLLFQSGALFTDLSVFDNVAFPIREHTNLPEEIIYTLVMMKLHTVGLRGAHELMPSSLSGGMRRRVALARTIALDPCMLMYDEPFAGQDPISMGMLLTLIKSLNESLGLTSLVVSHDIHETLTIADHVYIFSHGQIVGSGTPGDIRHSKSDDVHQFINGEPDGPVHFHYPAVPFREQILGSES